MTYFQLMMPYVLYNMTGPRIKESIQCFIGENVLCFIRKVRLGEGVGDNMRSQRMRHRQESVPSGFCTIVFIWGHLAQGTNGLFPWLILRQCVSVSLSKSLWVERSGA